MHLSLILSGGYRFMPHQKEKLLVSMHWVEYSDLEAEKLKTPQIAVILLEVADFLFKNEWVDWLADLESGLIHIPESYSRIYKTQSDIWWLFGEIPISPDIFCLSQAFHLLKWKLIQRQTGLFHVLFLKTCLMPQRAHVPSEFIIWNEYWSIQWIDLAKLYLTWDTKSDIDIKWIKWYPKIMNEIHILYTDLYNTRLHIDALNIK